MRFFLTLAVIFMLTSCHSKQSAPEPAVQAPAPPVAAYMPKAVVYQTSVPCPDNVAVGLNGSRTAIVNYPAPSDVSDQSVPIALTDGWWLDRRGVGSGSGFLNISYSSYAALPKPLSVDEMMSMLIPDAEVTRIERLPMTLQQAEADTAAVNAYILQNFK